MFQRILVAFNDTPEAQQAFENALALAKQFQAELFVFGAAEIPLPAIAPIPPYSYPMWTPLSTEVNELRREGSDTGQLQQKCTQANAEGVMAYWEYRIGPVGQLICAYAQEINADLVVLGRRGLRGVSEMILGSVSNYVMHHSPCSVLVVQAAAEAVAKVPLQEAS
jgi:nucleotide-binding universal stress UspA family protein